MHTIQETDGYCRQPIPVTQLFYRLSYVSRDISSEIGERYVIHIWCKSGSL